MADNDADILTQFQEFLAAKKAEEDAENQSEDFEIEIFDGSGKGVRTRRSHAKPFLQSLGLDLDPTPAPTEPEGKPGKKSGKTEGTPAPTAPVTGGMPRKYFTKPTGK